jgi:hypothetical protein
VSSDRSPIDQLADELGGRAKVGKLDIDDNRVTASTFNAQSIRPCSSSTVAESSIESSAPCPRRICGQSSTSM